MSLREEFELLKDCRPHLSEVHTGYDRVLFQVIHNLVEDVERLQKDVLRLEIAAGKKGVGAVLAEKTDHERFEDAFDESLRKHTGVGLDETIAQALGCTCVEGAETRGEHHESHCQEAEQRHSEDAWPNEEERITAVLAELAKLFPLDLSARCRWLLDRGEYAALKRLRNGD